MNKIRIGIDPGSDGYIVIWIEAWSIYKTYPMPKIGKEIDLKALWQLFVDEIPQTSDMYAVIEDVHAIFGSSAKATWSFSWATCALNAYLVARAIPFTRIAPKVWQKQMWEGVSLQKRPSSSGKTEVNDTKAISEVAAKRIFPDYDFRRTPKCSTNDNNNIDAMLICEYAKRNF